MPVGAILASTKDVSLKRVGILLSFGLVAITGLVKYADHREMCYKEEQRLQRDLEDAERLEFTIRYAEHQIDESLAQNPQLRNNLSREFLVRQYILSWEHGQNYLR